MRPLPLLGSLPMWSRSRRVGRHTCAALESGGVDCWGSDFSGQLGDGTTDQSDVPVHVDGLSAIVQSISAGRAHTCVVISDGSVECWGANSDAQLGHFPPDTHYEPVVVAGLGGPAVTISAAQDHTCALMGSGGVLCWGRNANGVMGNGSPYFDQPTPQPVSHLSEGVASLAQSSGNQECAILDTGSVKCWGQGLYGALGNGMTDDSSTPVTVVGLRGVASYAGVGGHHACAILQSGGVRCWGWNGFRQLGDGTTTDSSVPVAVILPIHQPDLLVRRSPLGSLIGADIYSASAVHERLSETVDRGKRGVFRLLFENDGTSTDSFVLQGCIGNADFGVTYLAGNTDITAEMVAGEYGSAPLAPGSGAEVKVVIHAPRRAGESLLCMASARWASGADVLDSVVARVTSV